MACPEERSLSMEFEYKNPSVWEGLDQAQTDDVFAYGERYKAFLDKAKTERECAAEVLRLARAAGFTDARDLIAAHKSPVAGDRLYYNHKNKAVVLMVAGKKPLDAGLRIVGAHMDAPRLDLKAHPLYEDGGLALLKTHYYGGIKKYQWTCLPLSLHGLAYTAEGQEVHIRLGEDEGDPVLYITDLLPHLAKKQQEKQLASAITGEDLNAVAGHIPLTGNDEEKSPVKARILGLIHEKYDLAEEDLLLSELELVPAQKAVDVGLDRSLIASCGHDDRSCAYAALEALTSMDTPEYTAVGLFVDKEEIGSVGNTSMSARYFENLLAELLSPDHADSELAVRRTIAASAVLSADVTAALDPTYPEVMDKRNTALLGHGACLCKFTGARGKSGSNDANAEFLQDLRQILTKRQVPWQTGELGAVDAGGGGTIAYILACRGAEVVDCGVPMLSMHAPVELVSKADVWAASQLYRAFLEEA
jgi:aspartyl aminopeptidase